MKNLAKKIKEDQKKASITTEEKFIKAIDDFLIQTVKENKRVSRKAFNPSSYYKCARMMYYRLNGFEENKRIYPRSERILAVGTITHEWIQDKVLTVMDEKNAGIKLISKEELPSYNEKGFEIIEEHDSSPIEVKFLDFRWTKEFPISAMVDGAFEFEGKSMLFEFKTINTDDFSTLFEPLFDHVAQGAVYALCTGIKRVMFLYIDKNNQNLKAFIKEYTEKQLNWVKDKVRSIEEKVLNRDLPEKEESRECNFCGYKSYCSANEK